MPTVTEKMNWGMLGTAKIGRVHVIPAMQRGTQTHVAAIASRDADRARHVADELGIERAYGSYEALLADPAIEAVYNPLPNHLHVPWSIKALEAGKHVLCEKPVALTAEEAGRLAEAAGRSGRLVAEAFMVRHHPQWQKAREIARSGRLGEVRAIQTLFAYALTDPDNVRNKPDIGGGGLYDIGCYAINTARYIFGAEPARVVGLFDTDPVMRIDRMTSGLADFGDGRHLAFTCATQLVPTQRVTIMGTAARVEIDVPFNPLGDAPTHIAVDDGRDLSGGGREPIVLPAANHYTRQGDAFVRAARGEAPLEFGIADSLANMRVIDAFFRSGRSNGWETP